MAREMGLDLVEVAAQAKPPVCRIMDYSRWKYEQAKRAREARKKQKVQDVKELKMRPTIDDHDFEVKVRACQKFLSEGDKVRQRSCSGVEKWPTSKTVNGSWRLSWRGSKAFA